MEKILGAYATKYGSTEKIAEKIGRELRQAELQTDMVPVDRVRIWAGRGSAHTRG